MPGLRLLVKEPQHAGRDHRGLGLLDAPAGHAAVDPFDDDSDPWGWSSVSKVLAISAVILS